ncbi:methyl-accepting chemotaxis sensory transducer [Methanolacinia petrolearia DSM 11571]|uniref:Methyl-accepting chemotaxis sensory transducer n=1 Tax=Methanolacinia petrolearia (strain DSM 11571 / OCM 486 / SEBR 4847) TaxID=679926 RepID=E1RGW1_METP4|nr:methyl-accepting chemotaxis protein [Methanolacinia petrolearia]ADN37490.1 methyl-accepting chemotaxis sensory transducer [Methanolacinia petrolearia DSM 11571]
MSIEAFEKTIENAVDKGIYEKMDLSGLEPEFRRLGGMVNSLLEKLEESGDALSAAGEQMADFASGKFTVSDGVRSKCPSPVIENADNLAMTLNAFCSAGRKKCEILSDADFSARIESSEFKGGFAEFTDAFNRIPENFSESFGLTLDYLGMIAEGKVPDKIDKGLNGGFSVLRDHFNDCINGLNGLKEAEKILKMMSVNDYTDSFHGEYKGVYGDIGKEINIVQTRLKTVIDVCVRTSNGDLSKLGELEPIGRRSEHDELLPAIILMMKSVQKIIDEIALLSEHVVNGSLAERIDVNDHKGAYKDVVTGVNEVLNAIVTPLNEAIRVSDSLATGDFSERFDNRINTRGDLQRFRDAINNVGVSVSRAIDSANDISNQVVISSNEVSKGADEVAKASEGVANTSQITANLTKELLGKIEEINHQIADLSASNEEIASTSQEVFNAANDVVETGKEAQNLGNDANKKMTNVEVIAKESVVEIEDLKDKIKEVSNVVKVINDITSQINLLALNAAIEAARAGEHGRGFAVVAGEVKNLAGEARTAADSIGNVVSTVLTSSEKTAVAIKSANEEIIEGVGSVNNAIEALNTIIRNASQVSHDIGEITKAIEDQANIANNVVRMADQGTVMTNKVQKEAEELAALAEEASASTEEIGSAIHEVNALSNQLKEEMSHFRT